MINPGGKFLTIFVPVKLEKLSDSKVQVIELAWDRHLYFELENMKRIKKLLTQSIFGIQQSKFH